MTGAEETLATSPWTYVTIAVAGGVATAVWRLTGAILGSGIELASPGFRFAKLVSIALIAGLVAKFIVFPQGALADLPRTIPVLAFLGGLGGWLVYRRYFSVHTQMSLTVGTGGALLVALELLRRSLMA
ncbi:MAG: hypothetical protein AAGF32_10115 [Pseudomonadota bacterium]